MLAVHYGGGNIGRGFIGLMLAGAGYRVVFIDVNAELVGLLNRRGRYEVWFADGTDNRTIVDGVSAIDGNDMEKAAQAVARADIVTTAVGAAALPHIAGGIAQGLLRRLKEGRAAALPIIACENAIGASSQLKKLVAELLPDGLREQAMRQAAFPDAAVDRIVPVQHHEDDPLKVVVEPFCEWVVDRTAWPGGRPDIAGIHLDRLQPYIERKLFTVNTGHCVATYHGYLRGWKTIQQAMGDAEVLAEVRGALSETGAALRGLFGFGKAEHDSYVETVLRRFRNPHLTDEVVRVGRSPLRKLSANDRLIRPALAALSQGADVPHLARAAAAALMFDYAEDAEAAALQRLQRQLGLSAAIAQVTGLPDEHPLHIQIAAAYRSLAASRK